MIKKTVTYVDYNGVERTEDFHFNLTSAEVMEQELTTPGGFSALLQKIIDANDIPSIVEVVKKILLMSYGVKSDDGRRFVKSAELSEAFKQTEAYTMIFMEIATNAEKGVESSRASSRRTWSARSWPRPRRNPPGKPPEASRHLRPIFRSRPRSLTPLK